MVALERFPLSSPTNPLSAFLRMCGARPLNGTGSTSETASEILMETRAARNCSHSEGAESRGTSMRVISNRLPFPRVRDPGNSRRRGLDFRKSKGIFSRVNNVGFLGEPRLITIVEPRNQIGG